VRYFLIFRTMFLSMRLLFELSSQSNAAYDLSYYTKIQGFVYNLVRNSPYSILHNKKGYKFFCFSNIFPIGNFKEGDKRRLIISSPDIGFIRIIQDALTDRKESIHIGDLSFKVESMKVLQPKLRDGVKLITATPIIIRIPKANYERYGIKSDKEYVYWRPTYSFEAFIKQLEENIFKKYNEFYNSKTEEFPLFEIFNFKKSTVNHVVIDGKEYRFFGSTWEFIFNGLKYDRKRREILEFAMDCGFGERNTFGFGFVNVVKGVV